MPEPKASARPAATRLAETTDAILAEVRALPPEIITWVPDAGVWSVMDILCHIREFVPFWTGEALRMVSRPSDLWGRDHTDTARLAAVTNTAAHRLDDVVADIQQAVRHSTEALRKLSPADLSVEATSKNPRWGRKPASFVVDHLLAEHVEKHLGQVRRNINLFNERRAGTPRLTSPQSSPTTGNSMNALLFPAPPVSALSARGRQERVPVRRIFCVGRNYEAHAREMGVAVDREAPFYFTKSAEHYVPSGATVAYPPGTANFHYELELVAVIGTPAFRVPADRATECVFGYACGLDMTRRDLQLAAREQRRPWDLGKDVEQSAVVGEVVPASEIGHPGQGVLELRVNGHPKQQSDLSLMIHSVPEIVAHLSGFYHLQPGDLIFTGTPEGVGAVTPGDQLGGTIAGVGTIALTIGPAAAGVRQRGHSRCTTQTSAVSISTPLDWTSSQTPSRRSARCARAIRCTATPMARCT